MRQLSVRRAASRSGDIIRPQSRSMNFTPLLLAPQITSRTTRNPLVFGQYAKKRLEARHIRRTWISPQDFIQVVPLISEQETGTTSKAHLCSMQDVDTGVGHSIQGRRPNVAVPPVNLRGAVMGSVAQSSSQTSKTQTKKTTHNFLQKELFIRKYGRLAGNGNRRVIQNSWTEFRRGRKVSGTAAKESRSNKDQVPSCGWTV